MSAHEIDSVGTSSGLNLVARVAAYLFVAGAGLLIGGVAGLVVALFSGLIPITC